MRKFFIFLMMAFAITHSFSQSRVLTGSVSDEKGTPLVGATISIVGGAAFTTTNNSGVFTLNITSAAKEVEVTFIGYGTQRLTIGNQSRISVKMTTSDLGLSDVVVVAYGSVKKEALTGSVGVVKAEAIEKRPINNVTNAIEGAIPGVVVSSASGQPGSGNAIRVRGFGSINATSDPLFVVDGVPYVGGTSNINPDDVESITVLKDAASSALYGSRAANGVVIITTKKGQKGRNNISIRALQGIARRGLPEYERVDAFQYYPLLWEAYRNSLVYPNSGAAISVDSANKVASGLTNRTGIKDLLSYNPFNVPANTIVGTDGKLNPNARLLYADDLDWTNDLMRDGKRSDYSLNFSGGAEKSDYFMSLGYLKEEGYTIKSDFERFSARLNVNVQPRTWLKTGLNISGNYSTSNTANDGGSTNFVNPFFFSRNMGPIYPVYAHNMTTGDFVYDDKGNKVWDLGNFGSSPIGTQNGIPNRPSGASAGRHGLAETILNEVMYRRTVVSARSYADITFLKNFKFTNNVGVDMQSQYNMSYDNTVVGDGAPAGRADRETGNNTGLILSQLLNYGQKFNAHKVDVLVGHESFNQFLVGQRGFKQGQSLSGNTELNNFTTINSTTSYTDKYRIESYFSRFNYDYNGRYYLSASIRRDGNSRFAEESRWGTFWSVGGGWNMHKENFLSGTGWLDELKLRGSYGVVGVADGIGYYAYQGLYGFSNNANEPGIVQSQTAFLNRKLTWEENVQFDLGLDFSLFKRRISGSLEYYDRKSNQLLFAVPQPVSSGALTVNQNTANMYNKGIELQLSGDIVRSKAVTWNAALNLSTVISRITKMPELTPEFINGTKQYAVGHSQFDYWLRTYYGVDPTDGAALYVPASTPAAATRRVITNKEGGSDTLTTAIANAKFEYHGTSVPDLYGSFSQAVTFKHFTLSTLLTFQVGGKTYDALYQSLMSAGSYGGALHTDILKRWQKPGDVTDVPRMDAGTQRATDHNGTSSRWLIDASYFNIRTISLAYNLPQTIASRLKVNTGQVFVSAENVAFFSKRKGMNNQQAFSGVTSNAYPPARVISAGITLNL